MVHLTRLGGTPLIVNDQHILFIERTPDTMITLTTGLHLLVAESVDEVVARVIQFRQRLSAAPPTRSEDR